MDRDAVGQGKQRGDIIQKLIYVSILFKVLTGLFLFPPAKIVQSACPSPAKGPLLVLNIFYDTIFTLYWIVLVPAQNPHRYGLCSNI